MAKVSLYFDDRAVKKDGTAPVKIVIRNHGTVAHIPTNVAVPVGCWKDGKIVRGKGLEGDTTMLNQKIKVLFAKVEVYVNELCGLKSNMSATAIRDKTMAYLSGRITSSENRTLLGVIKEYIEQVEGESTRSVYITTYNYLERTLKRAHQINIEDVDIFWLKALKKTMLEGTEDSQPLGNNTMVHYMWLIRSAYRYAQKKGYIAKGDTPFAELKLPLKPVPKRALSKENLLKLFSVKEEMIVGSRLAIQNVWLTIRTLRLVFLLCGINIQDLYYLTEKDIVNGRLQTVRCKTGVPIDIKIEPETRQLINELKTPDGRLIGKVCRSSVSVTSSFLNTYAKYVVKGMSVYSIRHSWASTAVSLEIPDRTMSMGLAHRFGNAMDNVYITNDNKLLDKANRKIMDYVYRKGEFALKDNAEGEE